MTAAADRGSLPAHLAERVRELAPVGARAGAGDLVVYWMHHGVRAAENPALDVAHAAADALGLPLLVYQGLGGRHPHDSDRHHTFIMQGARDAAAALERDGVRHVFNPGQPAGSPGPLRRLARRAALVVTEDFPAPPFPRWTRALAADAGCPLWCVDTTCVVPMQQVGRAFDRAFAFRRAIAGEIERRVDRDWPSPARRAAAFEGDPGFEPVDWSRADIAELCAAAPIDHSVGPVAGVVGGAAAGLARWEAFRTHGLAAYDRLRNDAAIPPPRGVSGLSPYLHHGHVSPLRIAREASREGSAGAAKFLDELIVWRELAHNFCFHNAGRLDSGERLALLPGWARDTLREHAADARAANFSLETLARGRTGDALWDLAARALLARGALHNNLRMTWGKALPEWSDTPERAADLLFELNDRLALDGNDPNSFGGLLYCLGLFDRAFTPANPVLGTVRARPRAGHARRLDVQAFEAHAVKRPDAPSVAIVGAGLSGLAAARTLADQGFHVRVLERGRGVGGRAATRRADAGSFDHGAQYFTARDPRFRRHVDAWVHDGLVAEWGGTIVHRDPDGHAHPVSGGPRYVAVPGMSSLGKHLAADLEVTTGTEIRRLERTDAGWRLHDDSGAMEPTFDAVIVAAAPEQALRLLENGSDLYARTAKVHSLACWATLVAFDRPLDAGYDGAFIDDPCLAWVARDSSKPGRTPGERWVLHATPEWSAPRTGEVPDGIAGAMLEAFAVVAGSDLPAVRHLSAHRWGLARVDEGAGEDCLFDAAGRLAVCGDWCPGSRIEGAFLSGVAAAGRIAGVFAGTTGTVTD